MCKFFKKTRSSKACDECSRLRKRCDGKNPCSLCLEKDRSCTYHRRAKKRGPGSRKNHANTVANPSAITVANPSAKITVTNTVTNPIHNWTVSDFITTIVTDSTGYSTSILEMYFNFPYQHLPMYSKMWFTQNIQDVPLHVLHVIYALVLVNAKQALINGHLKAKPHVDYARSVIFDNLDECDPFMISTMMNLAMYYFYTQDMNQATLIFAMAIKSAQILGLDRDVSILWHSTASGRMLGNEIGMDKQFLRSLWFLLYQWDHSSCLFNKTPLLIDTLIPDEVINSYIPCNIGDTSNIPLK